VPVCPPHRRVGTYYCCAVGDGFGVGPTARVTALATLGLWQYVVDLVRNGVALGFEAHRGETQQGAKYGAQPHQGEQGGKEGVLGDQFKH
jgi:hypothetical protein